MTLFDLWAPNAERVELCIGDRWLPMERGERGHWLLDVPKAGPGTDYAFLLDDGPARPDPRSLEQPHGVHGPSRIVDHSRYEWRVPAFRAPPLASAIIYELHIGTFTPEGTLDAAVGRLDHLADLGVTHIELMPLNGFDGERGWGYDGVCWFAPHRAYTGGDGPDAVKRFVDACHERGLAVLLDVVYNHLGPSGNYLAEFAPYYSDAYSTPWGPAINLDGAGSDEVRRFICDNATMWLRDYRFDGLRLDAVHAFFDRSAVHLLEQITTEVRLVEAQVGRNLAVIAESDLNDPRLVRSREAGGYGCDAQWSDDFHHALHTVLTGEQTGYYVDFGSLAQLAKAITSAYVYDGCYAESRGRRHGRPPTGLAAHRFLAYAQNHDQVGNRAKGDRLSALISDGRLKVGAAITLLSPFVPMLFQGEEWGTRRPFQYFTDHRDPDLAEAVREGRRAEFAAFGWKPEEVPDPQDLGTFQHSKLDWSELQSKRSTEVLQWHRDLLMLRRRYPELTEPRMERTRVRFDESARWLTVQRGRILLCCNLADVPRRVPLPECNPPDVCTLLSTTEKNRYDNFTLSMQPNSATVLRL